MKTTASDMFIKRFLKLADETKQIGQELMALQDQPYWESDSIVSKKIDRLRRKAQRLSQQSKRMMREMRVTMS